MDAASSIAVVAWLALICGVCILAGLAVLARRAGIDRGWWAAFLLTVTAVAGASGSLLGGRAQRLLLAFDLLIPVSLWLTWTHYRRARTGRNLPRADRHGAR